MPFSLAQTWIMQSSSDLLCFTSSLIGTYTERHSSVTGLLAPSTQPGRKRQWKSLEPTPPHGHVGRLFYWTPFWQGLAIAWHNSFVMIVTSLYVSLEEYRSQVTGFHPRTETFHGLTAPASVGYPPSRARPSSNSPVGSTTFGKLPRAEASVLN